MLSTEEFLRFDKIVFASELTLNSTLSNSRVHELGWIIKILFSHSVINKECSLKTKEITVRDQTLKSQKAKETHHEMIYLATL